MDNRQTIENNGNNRKNRKICTFYDKRPSQIMYSGQIFSAIILSMISEKSQHCNLQLKHTFDILLTYEFCSECQYQVKNQSDVWQECFYLMKGNLEVHSDKKHYHIHAIAQLPNITLQTRLSSDMIDSSIMQTRMSA